MHSLFISYLWQISSMEGRASWQLFLWKVSSSGQSLRIVDQRRCRFLLGWGLPRLNLGTQTLWHLYFSNLGSPTKELGLCSLVMMHQQNNRFKNIVFSIFKSSDKTSIHLTSSTNFLACLSSEPQWFFSLVAISSIISPKLYMSDWADISPSWRYSGAMYPLSSIKYTSLIRNTRPDENAVKM